MNVEYTATKNSLHGLCGGHVPIVTQLMGASDDKTIPPKLSPLPRRDRTVIVAAAFTPCRASIHGTPPSWPDSRQTRLNETKHQPTIAKRRHNRYSELT